MVGNGRDQEMLQWIAMLTMLIDHIGIVWFEDEAIYRIIGRLAFPIYAYFVVQGMTYTSNRRRYVLRLAVLAILSQLPFSLLFHTFSLNVIATFLLAVLTMYGFAEALHPIKRWGSLVAGAVVLLVVPCDYGLYALLLMLIYRYAQGLQVVIYHLLLNTVYVFVALTSEIQMWSLLPSVLFAWTNAEFTARIRHSRAPKLLWRSFYPAHLLVLLVLMKWLGL